MKIWESELMETLHKYTREQKLQWFGEGPWCDEPDEVKFECSDMECLIYRHIVFEESGHSFGGFLNGYVKIPEYHPLYRNEKGHDLDFDVHYGVTFNNHFYDDDKTWWIGFNCAHSMDVVPSMIEIRKKMDQYRRDKFPGLFDGNLKCMPFNSTYKTLDFAINECKKLAEQLTVFKASPQSDLCSQHQQ